ncbi:CP4-57 prophage protein [Escherichia coli]|nr:CP4-57 prophage protein [Escherichia coli]
MRLASRFGYANQIRRDRPLTHEELMHYVPSIFGEDRHTSRSKRYAYIPTITVLEACSRKVFSHSSPARPVCATRAAGDTQNICCVCGGPER